MKKILLSALLSSALFAENTIGVNINSDDVEFQSRIMMNDILQTSSTSIFLTNVNILMTDDDTLVSAGLGVYNNYTQIDGLAFGLGLNPVFADNFVAIPFFIEGLYVFPTDNIFPKTSLSAKIQYAPGILSFSDADSYKEFRAEVDFEIIPSMSIYTGYRNIETNYNYGDLDFSDNFYGGLKYSF